MICSLNKFCKLNFIIEHNFNKLAILKLISGVKKLILKIEIFSFKAIIPSIFSKDLLSNELKEILTSFNSFILFIKNKK